MKKLLFILSLIFLSGCTYKIYITVPENKENPCRSEFKMGGSLTPYYVNDSIIKTNNGL